VQLANDVLELNPSYINKERAIAKSHVCLCWGTGAAACWQPAQHRAEASESPGVCRAAPVTACERVCPFALYTGIAQIWNKIEQQQPSCYCLNVVARRVPSGCRDGNKLRQKRFWKRKGVLGKLCWVRATPLPWRVEAAACEGPSPSLPGSRRFSSLTAPSAWLELFRLQVQSRESVCFPE